MKNLLSILLLIGTAILLCSCSAAQTDSSTPSSPDSTLPVEKEISDVPVPSEISRNTSASELSESTDVSQDSEISEESEISESSELSEMPESSEPSEVSEISEASRISAQDCTALAQDITYTGDVLLPELSVLYDDYELTQNEDYTLTVDKDVKDVGCYQIKISMQGDFEGEISADFYVLPPVPQFTEVSESVLKWDDLAPVANGYELSYSKDMEFSDDIDSVETQEAFFSLDSLPANDVYYFQVKAFTSVNDTKLYSSESYIWEVTFDQPEPSEPEEPDEPEQTDGLTYIDGVLIVNKTYGLPEDYGDGLDSTALAAFETMAADAENDDIYLYIVSGYRSYYTQAVTYENFCYSRGQEEADRISARPGHSEHQTGLAMDVNSTSFLFEDTPEANWLAENCCHYGFVIRYPKDKEDITGYRYEPWHIRYLGTELAEYLTQNNLTLEEYFGITSVYDE